MTYEAYAGTRCEQCKLTWNESPFGYIVKIQRQGHHDWISKTTSNSECILGPIDLTYGGDYLLAVSTVTSLGESTPAQLPWRHIG